MRVLLLDKIRGDGRICAPPAPGPRCCPARQGPQDTWGGATGDEARRFHQVQALGRCIRLSHRVQAVNEVRDFILAGRSCIDGIEHLLKPTHVCAFCWIYADGRMTLFSRYRFTDDGTPTDGRLRQFGRLRMRNGARERINGHH